VLELPALQRFVDDADVQGVKVVTVVSGDEVPKARELLANVKYTFPVLFDADSRVAQQYLVVGVPQTVVIREGLVKSRFVGTGRHLRLVDALRAETAVGEVEEAGSSGDPAIRLIEREGRYAADAVGGKPSFSLPVNRGRWTRLPDGAYLDTVTDDIVVIATSKGAPYTAGNAAVGQAIVRWTRLVESVCPASARVTSENSRRLGRFAESYFKVFAQWPDSEVLEQIPPCGYEARTDVHVAPDERRGTQRIIWRVPGDSIIYENVERWSGVLPGEKRPVGPHLRNHFHELKARLRQQGQVVQDALR